LDGALLDYLVSIAGMLGFRDDQLVVAAAVLACLEGMFLTPAPSGTAGAAKDLHGRFGRV
jgi:hypothetical protein